MLNMDEATSEMDGVNEFLDSISEVKDFRLNEEGRRPQRIEVFKAIHRRIVELLVTKDLSDEWLLQLIELEFEEEGASNKASHIARLLTSYVVNGPWVINPQTTLPKLQDSEHDFESQIAVSGGSHQGKKPIYDYDNIAELLNHHGMTINEAAQVTHATVKPDQSNYLETIQKRSEIVVESDTILGIAGFSPINREPEIKDDGPRPSMSTLDGGLDVEEEYLNQYRSHIELAGDSTRKCARISFLPRNARDDAAMTMSSISHVRLSVDHGIKSLASQINILQQQSGQLDQLFFIRSRSDGTEISSKKQEQHYAEVASIDMVFVRGFIYAYGETRETLGRCLANALEGGERKTGLIAMLAATYTWIPFVALVSPIPVTALATGTALYQLAQYYSSTQRSESKLVTLKELSPLLKTLEPIFDSMGINQFDPRHRHGSKKESVWEKKYSLYFTKCWQC